MAERAKRIQMYDENKFQNINPETLKLFQKYQIGLSVIYLKIQLMLIMQT